MAEKFEATCKRERVMTGSHVVVEPGYTPFYVRDNESEAKWLEQWAKKLYEFIRDHRSMDVNDVYVHQNYQDQCTRCGYEWETCDIDGVLCCASCGVKVCTEEESEAAP